MNSNRRILIVWWVVAIVLMATMAIGREADTDRDPEKVVFYVHCYDVGRSALEKLPGVVKVTSGFRRGREINAVLYWADEITVERMVSALKDAGTFAGIATP